MGQRHQLFVIARVRGQYRCVAAFHSQWLYGRAVVYAAARLMRAFVNPFNAAALATELSTLNDSDFERLTAEDEDDENPTVLCPYLTGLFISSCRVDMDHFQLLRLSLLPVDILPSECDNDDGYSCFDLTVPGEPRYCFWWPGRRPSKAQGYLDRDDYDRVDRGVRELLDFYSLADVSALADTWPDDFGDLLRADERAQSSEVSQPPPTSLSALSVVSALRSLLSADAHEVELDDAAATLAKLVVEQNHLAVLRAELLAAKRLNANGMFLLKQLLVAENSSFVDLKPWLSSGAIDAPSLLELSDALYHADSLDLSACSTLTADTLESLVLRLPNMKNVVALACPHLGTLSKSLPLSVYLATEPLLASVHHTRIDSGGMISAPECIRWVATDDPPAGLTVVLFAPPLRRFSPPSTSMTRYGVELAHFGAEGVVRGFTRFVQRLYDPDSWFDPDGFYFEMRGYFHPVGVGAPATATATATDSDKAPCYTYGALPSLVRSVVFAKADELWTSGRLSMSTARSGMQAGLRHPGWVLVLNTRGSMPEHRQYLPPADVSEGEYAFERWDYAPGQPRGELQPVEALSVREWAGRLPEGHGRVPEAVMAECEALLARLNVRLRSLPLPDPIET